MVSVTHGTTHWCDLLVTPWKWLNYWWNWGSQRSLQSALLEMVSTVERKFNIWMTTYARDFPKLPQSWCWPESSGCIHNGWGFLETPRMGIAAYEACIQDDWHLNHQHWLVPRHELPEEFVGNMAKHPIIKGLSQGQLRRCSSDFLGYHSSVVQDFWLVGDIPGILCERAPGSTCLWRKHRKLPHQEWVYDKLCPNRHIGW